MHSPQLAHLTASHLLLLRTARMSERAVPALAVGAAALFSRTSCVLYWVGIWWVSLNLGRYEQAFREPSIAQGNSWINA